MADDDQQSDVSINCDYDGNIMSSIASASYPIVNSMYEYERIELKKKILNTESIVTTDQLSKTPYYHQSPQPEAIIDGHTLRWPGFGVENAFFEGN